MVLGLDLVVTWLVLALAPASAKMDLSVVAELAGSVSVGLSSSTCKNIVLILEMVVEFTWIL